MLRPSKRGFLLEGAETVIYRRMVSDSMQFIVMVPSLDLGFRPWLQQHLISMQAYEG